jgi:cytochrome o ubiquinol oxidase subunit 2
VRRVRSLLLLALALGLGGCKAVVLDPSGDIALQQRNLLLESAGLMLLIIVPVMVLTGVFAWRYRAANKSARYEPDWEHSTQLELVIWGAPLLIIICLGALTWVGTHLLDPFRPLDRIAAGQPVPADAKPLEIQAVALDWKWLFIYPQYGIATVNEVAAPVDRPIDFRITSSSVMNSFYVPALAGQIYAMPAMETQLHAVINKPGTYDGFSANYSGAGFSGMHFAFHGLEPAGFETWVSNIRKAGGSLDRNRYLKLERPSENVPVRTFETVDSRLFHDIVNLCVQPGKMCMDEMAAIDAKGGLGLAGVNNVLPLEYDKYARRGATVFGERSGPVASICTAPPPSAGGGPARASASEAATAMPPVPLPSSPPANGAAITRTSYAPRASHPPGAGRAAAGPGPEARADTADQANF